MTSFLVSSHLAQKIWGTWSLYYWDSEEVERVFDKSGRIPKRVQPQIDWLTTSRWTLAWHTVYGGFHCSRETFEGIKEHIDPMKILLTLEVTPWSGEQMLSAIGQDLGELDTVIIGPPRHSCMVNEPISAANKARQPGSRFGDNTMLIGGGVPLGYEFSMVPHEVKEVFDLEDLNGLIVGLRRQFCARDLRARH